MRAIVLCVLLTAGCGDGGEPVGLSQPAPTPIVIPALPLRRRSTSSSTPSIYRTSNAIENLTK